VPNSDRPVNEEAASTEHSVILTELSTLYLILVSNFNASKALSNFDLEQGAGAQV